MSTRPVVTNRPLQIAASESTHWGFAVAVMLSIGAHFGAVWYSERTTTSPEITVTPGKTSILLTASSTGNPSEIATRPPRDVPPLSQQQLASITDPTSPSRPVTKRERTPARIEDRIEIPLQLTIPRYQPVSNYEDPSLEEMARTPVRHTISEPTPPLTERTEPVPSPTMILQSTSQKQSNTRPKPSRLFQPNRQASQLTNPSRMQQRVEHSSQERPDTNANHELAEHTPPPLKVHRETNQPSTTEEAQVPEFVAEASPTSTPYQGAVDVLPEKLSGNVSPSYPPSLYAAGITGKVELVVTVTDDGKVTHPTVHQTSGHKEFDQSALRTVKSWRFTPAKVNGRAVSYRIRVPVRFTIRAVPLP